MRILFEPKAGRAEVALGWCSRIKGLTRNLGGILFVVLLHNPLQAAQSVTLAWNPSPDPSVAGYKVYYDVRSHAYANVIHAGTAMSATIPGLVEGATYYFAVTAYTILGLESGYSAEIRYTVPTGLARLQIRTTAARQVILTVTGRIGRTYEILATQTFTAWTVIGTVTVGAGGSLEFTDTNAASFPRRFYRTREKP